jgi:dihydrolipoamide dehydrogenase
MATTPYDLIVIGGGPAGYVGAIRAAQLGKRVAVVEKERAGGTCLNWGCIPTKALLKNAELYTQIGHHAADFGLEVTGLKYDWDKVIGRSRKVADKLAGGIEFLLKKNKVDYIKGDASVPKTGTVDVEGADGSEQSLTAAKILIATGVVTKEMPGFAFNGTSVIGSRHALVLAKQPKEIIVIGAGAIGIEFAYFFNAFGTKVTVVEMMPNILPVEDTEVSVALAKSLTKQGIRILTGTKVEKAETTKEGVSITVSGGANESLTADVALVAIGVTPLLPDGAAPFKSMTDTRPAFRESTQPVILSGPHGSPTLQVGRRCRRSRECSASVCLPASGPSPVAPTAILKLRVWDSPSAPPRRRDSPSRSASSHFRPVAKRWPSATPTAS